MYMIYSAISASQAEKMSFALGAGVVAGFITKKASKYFAEKIVGKETAKEYKTSINRVTNLFGLVAGAAAALFVADRTKLLSVKELLASATALYSSLTSEKAEKVAEEIVTPDETTTTPDVVIENNDIPATVENAPVVETPIIVEENQFPKLFGLSSGDLYDLNKKYNNE